MLSTGSPGSWEHFGAFVCVFYLDGLGHAIKRFNLDPTNENGTLLPAEGTEPYRPKGYLPNARIQNEGQRLVRPTHTLVPKMQVPHAEDEEKRGERIKQSRWKDQVSFANSRSRP